MRSVGPSVSAAVLLVFAAALSGCRSPMVDVTLVNNTPAAMRVIEIDYPSASFGVQALAPGQTFHYRFKILGDGPLKLTYITPDDKQIEREGPVLHEGQQGSFTIAVHPTAVDWQPHLRSAS